MKFKKHDAGKPRFDLLPPLALESVAKVLEFGSRKYAPNNWAKAPTWGRYTRAAMGHLVHFMAGEDLDPETKLPHLAHAACCVFFLLEFQLRALSVDDRFRKQDAK